MYFISWADSEQMINFNLHKTLFKWWTRFFFDANWPNDDDDETVIAITVWQINFNSTTKHTRNHISFDQTIQTNNWSLHKSLQQQYRSLSMSRIIQEDGSRRRKNIHELFFFVSTIDLYAQKPTQFNTFHPQHFAIKSKFNKTNNHKYKISLQFLLFN